MERRTTKDTGETILVPAPASRKVGGNGIDWALLLRTPWRAVPSWGRQGYELGSWPEVVLALADHLSPEGMLHGYCTYVEGEITPRWFRSEHQRTQAVSAEACQYWANGRSDCPGELRGKPVGELMGTEGLCEPYSGDASGSSPNRKHTVDGFWFGEDPVHRG